MADVKDCCWSASVPKVGLLVFPSERFLPNRELCGSPRTAWRSAVRTPICWRFDFPFVPSAYSMTQRTSWLTTPTPAHPATDQLAIADVQINQP